MRVACFMSGSGTNARKIIERSQLQGASFRVELIFTDVRDNALDNDGSKVSRALDIAREHGIPYECIDIMDFYKSRGHQTKKDLSLRPVFDKMVVERVEPYGIDLIALAGYMSITTAPILVRYEGKIVNVHPADLTNTFEGERKYVGIHTVRDVILAGEKELRSSTHVVREKVDQGEVLVVSRPVPVHLPKGMTPEKLAEDKKALKAVVDENQERLKRDGDWEIYPLTIQMIGEGRFTLAEGIAFLDGKPSPRGLRLG